MGAYHCELCGKLRSDDLHGAYEWGSELVCEDCHTEATPENFEDWEVAYEPWLFGYTIKSILVDDRWQITHKDYAGPEDPRHFTGPSLADVWQQAIEYNEENQ